MKRFLFSILTCLPVLGAMLVASEVEAGGCRVVNAYVAPVVHKAAVVEVVRDVIVTTAIVPVATIQLVNTQPYGASYYPAPNYAPAPAHAAPAANPCAKTEEALKSALQRIEALERRNAPAPANKVMPPADPQAAVPGPSALLGIFTAKCSQCHDAKTAAGPDGGGLVLTRDGAVAPLTDKEQLAVVKAIYTARMPKSPKGGPKVEPLSDTEVAEVMAAMDAKQ